MLVATKDIQSTYLNYTPVPGPQATVIGLQSTTNKSNTNSAHLHKGPSIHLN